MEELEMPPARRDPRYDVQDVIAFVNDGESDVDLELDDTDASDEESDDDARGQENQPLTDCKANVDIKSEPEDQPLTDYTTSVDIKSEPENQQVTDSKEGVDLAVQTLQNVQTPELRERTRVRYRYRWEKKDFISPNTDFRGPALTKDVTSPHTPLEYFRKFVSKEMIEGLTTNTNEYSIQKNGKSVNTNPKEIEKILGMYLKMGLVQMPGTGMYWETDTQHPPVADVMSRNRFQSVSRALHFVNNLTVSQTEKKDKLWKLRPWLDSFRENCLQVVPEEHNSVDEIMIPFKGRLSKIKQYMHGKLCPWGFKIWVRTGISGMMFDFDVSQGSNKKNKVKSELGFAGDVVMKLASTLPEGLNYKIYASDYFTSVPLVVKLLDRGIYYVGTAKQKHLHNCSLEDEASFKEKRLGCLDYRVEGNHNICAVRWYGKSMVTLVSSFAGPETVEVVEHRDKATKTSITVDRPYILDIYNRHIRGVDLLDSLAAKYKMPLKSYRWYMYVFWHTITLAVVNAWLLYKRDCQALKMSKEEILNLRKFQAQLGSSLIMVGAASFSSPVTAGNPLTDQKRPSSGDGSRNGGPPKRARVHPPVDVCKDQIGHFPKKNKRGRCRHCRKGYTNTHCSKCEVRLCFSEDKNCFWDYHCN